MLLSGNIPGMAVGIYIYRLSMDKGALTRKMVLVR